MAAIIPSKFRLDTTDKFLASLASNTFYMALGRPNAWTDDTVPTTPYENDYTKNTLWEKMFAMKKIASTDAFLFTIFSANSVKVFFSVFFIIIF